MSKPRRSTAGPQKFFWAFVLAGAMFILPSLTLADAPDASLPPVNSELADTYPASDPYASTEHARRLDSIRECLAEGRISLEVAQAMANAENARRSNFNEDLGHALYNGTAQGEMVRDYINEGGAKQQ